MNIEPYTKNLSSQNSEIQKPLSYQEPVLPCEI
jgi:hypothetical protein